MCSANEIVLRASTQAVLTIVIAASFSFDGCLPQ
jgi:hypothetical protein